MSILVRKNDQGAWGEWDYSLVGTQMQKTYTAVYGDGRSVETPCDPYPVEIQLNGQAIRGLYDGGIWSLEEVEAVGGKIAIPFDIPEGKQPVGAATYTEDAAGIVTQFYDVQDIPPPPPPPTPQDKVFGMLDAFGLTLAEFRGVLNATGE